MSCCRVDAGYRFKGSWNCVREMQCGAETGISRRIGRNTDHWKEVRNGLLWFQSYFNKHNNMLMAPYLPLSYFGDCVNSFLNICCKRLKCDSVLKTHM